MVTLYMGRGDLSEPMAGLMAALSADFEFFFGYLN